MAQCGYYISSFYNVAHYDFFFLFLFGQVAHCIFPYIDFINFKILNVLNVNDNFLLQAGPKTKTLLCGVD
jgi:hypothetical protein